MPLNIINESELLQVLKPAQYMGGERGSVVKNDSDVDFHFCLAFPDTYEVGMSHIGIQILYDLINRDPKVWAERVYVPQPDMEALLRKKNLLLSSLESKRPLSGFDVLGFSLQYELCMTGILLILDLGGIPLRAKDRTEEHPIVIGGGPVCYHPEPFADFFDAFLIGDGEELVPEFIGVMRKCKAEKRSRAETLRIISKIEGVYVPSFFEPQYDAAGKLVGTKPLYDDYTSIRRRIIPSLVGAPYPTEPIVPNIEAIHDRLSVEVMRGCVRGCRFCQAGYLYRPQRERSPEDILKIVEKSLASTGYEELSLLSLSTADYCSILPLLSSIKERFAENDRLAISFPSTRVDALKPELLQEVQPIRRSGFTIAPEAGTQRLRDVINKGVTDEELMETCRNVFRLGWSSVKLYFMIGLPTETDEDIEGIIETGRRVKEIAGRKNDVTVSASTFVPKPHTPFQWAAQISEEETRRKQNHLLKELKKYRVNFRYHNAFSTFLEGVFARADRKLGAAILRAYELGCRLEGWTEKLVPQRWMQAFQDTGIEPYHYLHARSEDDALSWDHISCDIPKSYFLKEWKRALALRTTPDCLTKSCSICGACDYDAVRNELFDRSRTEKRLNIVNPPWLKIINARETGAPVELESPDVPQAARSSEGKGKYGLKEYLRTEPAPNEPYINKDILPALQRVRVKYHKLGKARFFSHLELKNIFFRALRRAAIPVAFTRGFNPKPKLSFGPPLQLGIESLYELVDIYLHEKIAEDRLGPVFTQELNRALPEGLQIEKADTVEFFADSIQNIISSQTYIAKAGEDEGSATALRGIGEDWPLKTFNRERKGKSEIAALKDYARNVLTNPEGVTFEIPFRSGVNSAKPNEVIHALTGMPFQEFSIRKVDLKF